MYDRVKVHQGKNVSHLFVRTRRPGHLRKSTLWTRRGTLLRYDVSEDYRNDTCFRGWCNEPQGSHLHMVYSPRTDPSDGVMDEGSRLSSRDSLLGNPVVSSNRNLKSLIRNFISLAHTSRGDGVRLVVDVFDVF